MLLLKIQVLEHSVFGPLPEENLCLGLCKRPNEVYQLVPGGLKLRKTQRVAAEIKSPRALSALLSPAFE